MITLHTRLAAIALMPLLIFSCAGGGSLESEPEVKAPKPVVENNASMGREIAKEIFRKSSLIISETSLAYANTVARYVAGSVISAVRCPTAVVTADQVRVAILAPTGASGDSNTAYSIPGGLIFFSSTYLKKVSSEDEFAGLIAKELVSSLCEYGVPSDLPAQAAEGWTNFISKLPTTPLRRDQLMFGDKIALNSLYKSGYELLPYIRFVEKNETSARARSTNGRERSVLLNKLASNARGVRPSAAARKERFEKFKADLK